MEEPIREAEALTNENDQFIFFTNSIKRIKKLPPGNFFVAKIIRVQNLTDTDTDTQWKPVFWTADVRRSLFE